MCASASLRITSVLARLGFFKENGCAQRMLWYVTGMLLGACGIAVPSRQMNKTGH